MAFKFKVACFRIQTILDFPPFPSTVSMKSFHMATSTPRRDEDKVEQNIVIFPSSEQISFSRH